MLQIYPNAEFAADFPDDMVEKDGEIVQFPGRNVAEALAGMLRAKGYQPSPLLDEAQRGWSFEVPVERRRVWLLVSQIDDFILQTERHAGLFPRMRDEEIHAEVLTALHEGMSADPRFADIKWRRYDEIQTDAPGRPAPVARSR